MPCTLLKIGVGIPLMVILPEGTLLCSTLEDIAAPVITVALMVALTPVLADFALICATLAIAVLGSRSVMTESRGENALMATPFTVRSPPRMRSRLAKLRTMLTLTVSPVVHFFAPPEAATAVAPEPLPAT